MMNGISNRFYGHLESELMGDPILKSSNLKEIILLFLGSKDSRADNKFLPYVGHVWSTSRADIV